MPVSDVLKGFRDKGYGGVGGDDEESEESGPRMIKLTDDEVKELQGYQKGPGMEQQCLVSGRLGDNGDFSVTSVHSPGGGMGDEKEMASEVMGKMGQAPLMQSQTMPSPS